jgi:spore coat polysaccharide biosynthesis protein SpsF
LLPVIGESDYSRYRWTVDTREDLEFARAVYARFNQDEGFTWRDVLALLEREPALIELNRHVDQKLLEEG